MLSYQFSTCIREELWHHGGGQRALRQQRLDVGWSTVRPGSTTEIQASDSFPSSAERDRLLEASRFHAADFLDPLDEVAAKDPLTLRLIRRARQVRRGELEVLDGMTLVIVHSRGRGNMTFICRSQDWTGWLKDMAAPVPDTALAMNTLPPRLPILWCRGTSAVLMHEAVGHPSEHGLPPVSWPDWLEVVDDPLVPSLGEHAVDDAGEQTRRQDLIRGGRPTTSRRWSFRDVPAQRMSNLLVKCRTDRTVSVAPRRIEVLATSGGELDSLTDRITISVSSARLVDGAQSQAVRPFTFSCTRSELARQLTGFTGPVEQYAGVICSDEGQQLPVGTWGAPLLVDWLE